MNPSFEVEDFDSANDLASYLSTIPAGLVITSLRDKNDLVQVATFMKIAKKVAKDTPTKVVVMNFSGDRNYEKAIAKLGILDLVEPSINTKALKFKLDFWMKSLNAQAKANSSKMGDKVVKNGEGNKNGDKKPDPSAPIWTDPLDLEDDIWITKESECKKILGKWLLRVVGPSPYVGTWVELKPGLWRYDLKEAEKEMFVPNEGSWYFAGDQKPDFVWKENTWLISGENFDLFFKNSKQIYSRLKSKEKVLTVCKNSLFAKTKEQVINESFDKEMIFKKEAENLDDLEGKNKTDQLQNGQLQGKGKTDEVDLSALEGKGKTDQLDVGNLEGKNKTPADRSGNLKGNLESIDNINQEELDQKANTKKESTYWNGKNAYEKEGKSGDFGVKPEGMKDSPNLEAPTDNEHKKHYKNHNEAQSYEKNSDGYKGKSSTDEIPKFYDDKDSEKTQRQAKENRPDEYAGKSETEKLKSHYGQREQKPFEEKGDGAYGGKSSTDKLPSHYGNPKEAAEKEQRDRQQREIAEIDKLEKQYKDATPEREKAEREARDVSLKERAERPELQNKDQQSKDKRSGVQSESVSADIYAREKKGRPEEEARERDLFDKAKADKQKREGAEREGMEEEKRKAPLKGTADTDRMSSHYGSKRGNGQKDSSNPQDEEYGDLFDGADESRSAADEKSGRDSKRKVADRVSADKNFDDIDQPQFASAEPKARNAVPEKVSNDKDSNILPLDKARQERAIQATQVALDEAGLEELTRDSKVISFITSKGKKIPCELNDFFDDTIIFLTQEKGIDISATVNLDMSFKFLAKDKKLGMEGKVLTVDDDGEGNNFVTIQLSKENSASFDLFMRLYETRQSNVTEFIKKVKGL